MTYYPITTIVTVVLAQVDANLVSLQSGGRAHQNCLQKYLKCFTRYVYLHIGPGFIHLGLSSTFEVCSISHQLVDYYEWPLMNKVGLTVEKQSSAVAPVC